MPTKLPRALALPLLAASATAVAQSAPPPATATLEAVTVIGHPIIEENRFGPFGGQTTVVTQEQIEDLNATDVASALRRTPGVTISRFNPVGSFGGAEGGALFIRGLGSARPGAEIKTFIDGVPFYMGVWNHPLLDLLPINGMASIDVLKGPQPDVVGNTLASVNLTTRSAPAQGAAGNLMLQGGSFGTFIQQFSAGGRSGDWSGLVAQGYQSSNGDRESADGRLANLLAKGAVALAPGWTAGVTVLGVDNSVDDPGPEGMPQLRNGTYETTGTLVIASLEQQNATGSAALRLYYSGGEGNWLRQAGTAGNTLTDWDSWGARARGQWAPWSGGELLAGIDYDSWSGNAQFEPTKARASTFSGPTFQLLSPYLGVAQTLGWGGFSIVPAAGLRYYDHNEFGAEWAPYAGLKVGKGGYFVQAGYARGVNYPGLDVVVFSSNIIPPLGQSWRNLAAETSDHYQIGVGYAVRRLAADLVYFTDRISNRYVFVPPPPPPPTYTNRGSQDTDGVEATLRYEFSPAASVFLGATWLNGTPADLPYLPDASYVAGLSGGWGPLRYSLDAEYRSSMYVLSRGRASTAANTEQVGASFLLNGRLFYTLPPDFGRSSEVFVALDNLTNAEYEYRPGYPMPGTSVLVGVNLRF
jgi:outer membrane receptor protein involved in Fe transport